MSGTRPRLTLLTDGVVVATVALIGLRLGLTPIKDNSAFTHLATGIGMVADGWLPSIPRVDRYTYTAHGQEWVVQSWLPAWSVGVVERVFGPGAVLLVSGAASALLAALMATLARTGSALPTAGVAGLTMVIGAQFWAPRPLMVGLLCLALTVLAVERGWSPWWLVPLGWVWVQSHGSFPLGVVFAASAWLGAVVSDRSRSAGGSARRVGLGLVGGIALGALNPLGPTLVVFPLTAVTKREVFSHISEWQPLSFDTRATTVAILGLTVAAVLCIRRRLPLHLAVPVVVFAALAFSARRNVAMLAIVLAWALGAALRRDRAAAESAPVGQRLDPVLGGLAAVVAVIFVALAVGEPAINTQPYPVASIQWAEQHGRFDEPHRVLSKDFVGNYVGLRRGASGDVFIDDRYDMFPVEVAEAYFDLLHDRNPRVILDRYEVDTVIWPLDDPLVRRLRRQGWTEGYRQELGDFWVVLLRAEP